MQHCINSCAEVDYLQAPHKHLPLLHMLSSAPMVLQQAQYAPAMSTTLQAHAVL
jgi:hypothetical protein